LPPPYRHITPRSRNDGRISTLPCTEATLSPRPSSTSAITTQDCSAPRSTSQHLMNIEIGNFNIKAILPSYMSCATPDKIRPRWDPVRINVRIYVSYVRACVLSRFESHWRVNYASHDVFCMLRFDDAEK